MQSSVPMSRTILMSYFYSSCSTAARMLMTTYRGGCDELTIASAYLPYDTDEPLSSKDMSYVADNYRCSKKKQLIIPCAAKACHILRGSTGTNLRGQELMGYLVSINLNIHTQGKKQTSLVRNR
jgi:hypothetical protein